MKKNIDDALALYVDQPLLVFTDKLEANLEKINQSFLVIDQLFKAEGIEYYAALPQAEASRKKFAKEFCDMTKRLEAAKMQGFLWEKSEYEFEHTNGWVKLKMELDEQTYKILLARYRELFQKETGGALLIITHSTRILESLHVDYTHVLVKGRIIKSGDGTLVEEINEKGFEQFEG